MESLAMAGIAAKGVGTATVQEALMHMGEDGQTGIAVQERPQALETGDRRLISLVCKAAWSATAHRKRISATAGGRSRCGPGPGGSAGRGRLPVSRRGARDERPALGPGQAQNGRAAGAVRKRAAGGLLGGRQPGRGAGDPFRLRTRVWGAVPKQPPNGANAAANPASNPCCCFSGPYVTVCQQLQPGRGAAARDPKRPGRNERPRDQSLTPGP